MRAEVAFSVPPVAQGVTLPLRGQGVARIEEGALVLEGKVPRGRPFVLAAAALFTGAVLGVLVEYYLAAAADAAYPTPSWPLAVGGVGLVSLALSRVIRTARTIEIRWMDVRGAAPSELAMHLFTTKGEILLAGQDVHVLGQKIMKRLTRG